MDNLLLVALIIAIMVIIIVVNMIRNLTFYKTIDIVYYKEQILIYGFLLGASIYITFSILRHLIVY